MSRPASPPTHRAARCIVSEAVVDESGGAAVTFRDVGPVELKGVTGAHEPVRGAAGRLKRADLTADAWRALRLRPQR